MCINIQMFRHENEPEACIATENGWKVKLYLLFLNADYQMMVVLLHNNCRYKTQLHSKEQVHILC